VTATLEREQRRATSTLRHEATGRPLAWANPAVGLRNAIAPPMVIIHGDDGRCWSEFTLNAAYEGPPGWVHGGICALVLDHILGEAASDGLTAACLASGRLELGIGIGWCEEEFTLMDSGSIAAVSGPTKCSS
jgi:hypothetical protein